MSGSEVEGRSRVIGNPLNLLLLAGWVFSYHLLLVVVRVMKKFESNRPQDTDSGSPLPG
jgi:hypothetical protein